MNNLKWHQAISYILLTCFWVISPIALFSPFDVPQTVWIVVGVMFSVLALGQAASNSLLAKRLLEMQEIDEVREAANKMDKTSKSLLKIYVGGVLIFMLALAATFIAKYASQ